MGPFWTESRPRSSLAIVAGQMIGAAGTREFSLSIFLSLFILWASFGANQWLQYRRDRAVVELPLRRARPTWC